MRDQELEGRQQECRSLSGSGERTQYLSGNGKEGGRVNSFLLQSVSEVKLTPKGKECQQRQWKEKN